MKIEKGRGHIKTVSNKISGENGLVGAANRVSLPPQARNGAPKRKSIDVCEVCKAPVGKGLSHICSVKKAPDNIVQLVETLPVTQKYQFIYSMLKKNKGWRILMRLFCPPKGPRPK